MFPFRPRPKSELITTWEALEPLAADWDRLWRASPRARRLCYPFRWVREVMAFFDRQRGTTTRPWAVVTRDRDGSVTGIAPLARDPGAPGYRVRTFNDWVERNHAFLAPGPVGPLAREVLLHLRRERVDGIHLRGVLRADALALIDAWEADARCSVAPMCRTEGDGVPGNVWWDRRAIVLGGSWDEWLRSRGGNYRSSLRRSMKRAAKAGKLRYWRHSAGRQVCGEPMSTDELVAAIAPIEARAWQGERHFAPDGDGRLILEQLARAGVLELSLLFLDERCISYVLGHVAGGAATTKYLGYEPDFAQLSPGIIALAELVRTTCETGHLDQINLRGSTHQYKAQMADVIESSFEVELLGRTPRGLLSAIKRARDPRHRLVGRDALRALVQPDPAPERGSLESAPSSAEGVPLQSAPPSG